MSVVIDASVVVAALVDSGDDGRWSAQVLAGGGLVAPHLMPVEVASVLRRAARAGDITDDVAALAHADATRLPVDLVPYAPLSARVWELRGNVSPYDAWYVAAAEALEVPLVTLDTRLARAPGVTCQVRTPMT